MRRGRQRTAAARTHAERLASRDGYLVPESPIRLIGNTPLTPFLGGGPAVLLQVAHPLVAAGVVQHSDFRRDLWRRLIRTLGALYLITYGSKEEADRAGQAVQAVHEYVCGETFYRPGLFPAGTRYSASDPELQLWVHATLVESSLAAYQRFVRRLLGEEQERYYREMSVVARLFGVPAEVLPRSLSEFREYFSAQIAGDTITVTPPARAVAEVIVEARLRLRCAYLFRRTGLRPRGFCRSGFAVSTVSGGALCTSSRSRWQRARSGWRRPRFSGRGPADVASGRPGRVDRDGGIALVSANRRTMIFEEREVVEEAAERWWLFLLTGSRGSSSR